MPLAAHVLRMSSGECLAILVGLLGILPRGTIHRNSKDQHQSLQEGLEWALRLQISTIEVLNDRRYGLVNLMAI